LRNFLTCSVMLAAALVFPYVLSAQMGEEPNPAPADRVKKDQPAPVHDLSGTWAGRPPLPAERNSVYGTDDGGWWNYALRGEDLSMTPWAQVKFKENKPSFGPNKEENSNDGAYACLPPGVPRVYASIGAGMQITDVPGRTLMFFGENVRQIYTDGRQHPKNLKPLWMGHSIGTWDGDTFIVDTVDIKDSTWIDRMGHPHSDALHLVERFHRTSYNTLELELTIDDPKAYTAPWNAHKVFQLRPPKNVRAGGGACEDVFINEAFGLKPKLPSR
jgi:hypothetical protein